MQQIPWPPIRSSLADNFSFGDIKVIIGYTGIDMSALAHLEQQSKGSATKSQLLSAIDKQLGNVESISQDKVASICCEEILSRKPHLIDELDRVLTRVGWKFAGTSLIPIEIFDLSELRDLPSEAHEDLEKAAVRLRDGDLSGALTSACAALDSTTAAIYQKFNLGNPSDFSFQTRIVKSLAAVLSTEHLQDALKNIHWSDQDIKIFTSNFNGALNQAAYLMQKLRSDMGDVHGTKPIITALVFDSIKWSSLLLRFLNN